MSTTAESPEFINNILDSLRVKERTYQGGDHIYTALGDRTMTAIAGFTGAGKTTTTTEIIRLDPDFKEVNTSTTRPHRPGDPEGFRTGVSYTEFNDAVINENLVNFNVIGDNVYGTYQSGFPGRHNVGPIMSRSIPQMLNSGFRDVNVVYMLVEEQEYERRLRQERMHFTDFTPRIIEAGDSREFAELNAKANWLYFVESTAEPDGATKAARKVIDIVRHNSGEFIRTDHALRMLEGMYKALHRVARDVH